MQELLTIQQVADLIGVAKGTVKRWVWANKIKATRINNRGDMRFREEDVKEYLRGMNEN